MKQIKLINYNFESWPMMYLHQYIKQVGFKVGLYHGKSSAKHYAPKNADYLVKIWQTKKHIMCEVCR